MRVTVPLPKNQRVLCQQWTEHTVGWGMTPAGYSYHVTEADLAAYVERHWTHVKAEHHGEVPMVHDAPNGNPYWVDVTSAVYNKVTRSPLPGLRLYNMRPAPPEGALEVWRSTGYNKDLFCTRPEDWKEDDWYAASTSS